MKSKMKKQKRPDVQYLRVVAIAAVLGFHLRPELVPQGFLGVDIFFVISGYLMTLILNFGQKSLTMRSIFQFYERRMKRLFPAYFLVILGTLFICGFYLIALDFNFLRTDALWATVFSTNLQSMLKKETYFNLIGDYKFFLHTWSLSVEFQYYLLAPFLIYGIYRSRHPLIATTVIGLISLIFQIITKEFETISFSCVFSRIWQFLIGSFVFYLEERRQSTQNPSEDEVELMEDGEPKISKNMYSHNSSVKLCFTRILIIFSLSAITFMPVLSTTFYYSVLIRITATILTGIAMFVGWNHEPNFLSRVFVYFGDISYSVYLIHWPVIILAKYLQIFESWSVLHNLGIIFILSILQYEMFEKKLLKASTQKVFLICIGLIIGIVVIETQQQGLGYTSSIPQHPAVAGNQLMAKECENRLKFFSCNWDPEMLTVVNNKKPTTSEAFFCSYNGTGKATIFVTGNSFAIRQVNTIETALRDKYKKLYFVSRPNCLPFESFNGFFPKRWGCDEIINKTVQFLEKFKPDFLIITQRLSGHPKFQKPLTMKQAKIDNTTLIVADYLKMFSQFVKKIFIIEPHVVLTFDPVTVLAKELSQGNSIDKYHVSMSKLQKEIDPGWFRILAAMDTCPKCESIPIRSIFCKDDKCPVYEAKRKLSLFCDYGHLSPLGVEKMVPIVKTYFNKALANLTLD